MPSTTLGSAFKNDFLHKSFTVAIIYPVNGPYVSLFFSSASDDDSDSYSSYYCYLLGDYLTASAAALSLTISIFSMMNTAPMTLSSNNGPALVAISNPVVTAFIKSLAVTSCACNTSFKFVSLVLSYLSSRSNLAGSVPMSSTSMPSSSLAMCLTLWNIDASLCTYLFIRMFDPFLFGPKQTALSSMSLISVLDVSCSLSFSLN